MLNKLENALGKLYDRAPKLSREARLLVVNVWPVVALVFGVLQILAAIALWRWGHTVNSFVDSFNRIYGTGGSDLPHLNVFYWISFIALILDGALLIAAFSRLRVRAKAGWNLLFYGALLNLIYGIFSAFNNYGGLSSMFLQVVVTAVILYFLFQIREYYKR